MKEKYMREESKTLTEIFMETEEEIYKKWNKHLISEILKVNPIFKTEEE